ncbi:hypothetical protein [Streptomyces sp. NPDC048650]|uniref:hypothetical protein n=1 Tax=unclassified Streptomyces TaxID=2593676 RepID=UPI003717DFBB
MSTFRRNAAVVTGVAVTGAVVALVALGVAAAPAWAADSRAQPPSPASSAEDPYVLQNAERNWTGTFDGRPLIRLTPAAARTGSGVYFLYIPSSATVEHLPTPDERDAADWQDVLFPLPRTPRSLEVRYGDPQQPDSAEVVARVTAREHGEAAPR